MIILLKQRNKEKLVQVQFLNCLCLASRCSWMVMSRSIVAHDLSNSVLFVAVCKMVLNRFNAMLV
jgi:hypothetical protein